MRASITDTIATIFLMGLCAIPASAGTLELGGGTLQLGGSLAANSTIVAPGAALAGGGTIDGSVDLAGTLTPGTAGVPVGTITITDNLTCRGGSRFICDVTSHVNSDGLYADQVSGVCAVSVRRTSGAIPVDLAIINGAPGSVYTSFVMVSGQTDDWKLSSVAGGLLLTDLVGDSDGDDLSDWWELAYFSSRTNAVASADVDEDGADNLNEQAAGTDPGDPQSRFAVTSAAISSGDMVLTWASSTGRVYRISRATNLFAGFLPIASNIAATPAYNTYRDEDIINETSYFYRIEIE